MYVIGSINVLTDPNVTFTNCYAMSYNVGIGTVTTGGIYVYTVAFAIPDASSQASITFAVGSYPSSATSGRFLVSTLTDDYP